MEFNSVRESRKPFEKNNHIHSQAEKCIGCGECIVVCPSQAITVPWGSVFAWDVQRGLMDGFKGVASVFREKVGFINFGFDITPRCNCPGKSKLPVVPDIGILASRDVIACDKASYDLVI
ncbi:MAG: 4Fe-4S binding protein, partial [Candidatus Helarchaeota archaeon]|nr:4Fe-4S binding protein [Candidatus Helarchaeota archaeon]